ncbi:MFS transporter [Myxococcus sp. MxC21-1]|uniref:MFS transporter n=1 Tax=Myxococcus sp. MxC21-1 TaxID=3041439 RepID=UPI002931BE7E|nr:MFS transporter [Myxococcus sp. MxC21-1]WNZ65596.1 MFS transporter [Myxococcus sp. MxC21-1]
MTASFTPRQERLLILLLAGVQFTHLLDFMIVLPLGPEFMRLFSLSAAQFGTLVSSYTLASAAMGVLGLAWVDRFGRRSTLLVILGGFITATLACGAAQSHAWLLVARSIAGGCAGLMGAVIMSIIADTIPGERRGQAIGTVMSSLGLSAVAGVPLSLGMANMLGWRAPFWAIGLLGALLWFGLLAVLPRLDAHVTPDSGRQAPSVTALFTPGFALGWLLTFSVAFSSFLLIPYLSAFMVGNLGLKQTDLPWVYLAGGAAAARGASGGPLGGPVWPRPGARAAAGGHHGAAPGLHAPSRHSAAGGDGRLRPLHVPDVHAAHPHHRVDLREGAATAARAVHGHEHDRQ